jgi:putative two-component system response regulator
MNLEDGATFGPYRIVTTIGRGGMATVYKAHHPGLDRYVAIKVLPDFFAEDERYLERFLLEARSIARLRHPNILDVYDFGCEGGITYVVLELVGGGNLAERLGLPMDIQHVVAILGPIASALDHAHGHGVVHRDIKPSNILFHQDGAPVLADFGLAKMATSIGKPTANGIVLGTPEYMAPEQALGEPVGPASDIYSLGIVAYEMLTGRVPFQAETPVAVLLSHLAKPIPPTPELTGELSGHIDDALRRALAKTAHRRFRTAGEFVVALTPAAWPNSEGLPATGATISEALGRKSRGGRSKVLVVDDSAANRELIEACLAGVECEIAMAADGAGALKAIETSPPDLVLLDVQMPDMDGYEVCRRIKSNPTLRLVPVVMLTALHDTNDRVKALESGADDFMSKPVERVELVARVRSALRLKSVYDRLDGAELVIFALAAAVEAKDLYTQRHTQRVAKMARHLGHCLGLPEAELEALYRGGLVHDIGKVGVDDAILHKPGPLDPDELVKMRAHPEIGAEIVGSLGSGSEILPIIRHHHERFDGRGYPDGLRGEAIPLLARIVAICDAYDSLVNDRPYRRSTSSAESIEILVQEAGRQWDPELLNLFVTELPAISLLTGIPN